MRRWNRKKQSRARHVVHRVSRVARAGLRVRIAMGPLVNDTPPVIHALRVAEEPCPAAKVGRRAVHLCKVNVNKASPLLESFLPFRYQFPQFLHSLWTIHPRAGPVWRAQKNPLPSADGGKVYAAIGTILRRALWANRIGSVVSPAAGVVVSPPAGVISTVPPASDKARVTQHHVQRALGALLFNQADLDFLSAGHISR